MTRIYQVLVGAAHGDAVTTTALEIDALLPEQARGGLWARFFDADIADVVRPLGDLPVGAGSGDDVILLHVSIGEPEVTRWLEGRPERLAIYYHNVSPASAYDAYDPRFAELLRHGRAQLVPLLRRAELVLAASRYNATELERLGGKDVRVSPLVYDPGRLRHVEPHGPTAHHLAASVEGPVVLFVGQLLPHKRPDLLIAAYHVLTTYLRPEAHLIMVGAGRLPGYTRALHAVIEENNLRGAWITGHVTDEELAAFYRRADVFVTASEHEGFCAPLLEAMAFDVPVVARAFAAIPDTVGDAALLLDPDDGAAVLAEAVSETLGNAALAETLVQRGRLRVAAHSPDAARECVRAHLQTVLR